MMHVEPQRERKAVNLGAVARIMLSVGEPIVLLLLLLVLDAAAPKNYDRTLPREDIISYMYCQTVSLKLCLLVRLLADALIRSNRSALLRLMIIYPPGPPCLFEPLGGS